MDRSKARKLGAATAVLAILCAWLCFEIPKNWNTGKVPTKAQAASDHPQELRGTFETQEPERTGQDDSAIPAGKMVAGEEMTKAIERNIRPGEPVLESHQPGANGYTWAKGIDPTRIEFPISDSIKRACEKLAKLQHGNCHDHTAVLARLAKEGRDEAWATSVEDAIAAQVLAKPNFLIRSLDCRVTVCAVEIESTYGVLDRTAPDRLKTILSRVDTITGYERNSSNQLVTVTSITFTRK